MGCIMGKKAFSYLKKELKNMSHERKRREAIAELRHFLRIGPCSEELPIEKEIAEGLIYNIKRHSKGGRLFYPLNEFSRDKNVVNLASYEIARRKRLKEITLLYNYLDSLKADKKILDEIRTEIKHLKHR